MAPNDSSWGHLDWTKIDRLKTGLSLVPLSELDEPDIILTNNYFYNFKSHISYSEQIGKLKELTKRGYYVIACFQATPVSGHYIFFDYVDETKGDIRIFDSGFKGSWLSEFYTNKNKELQYFILLKGKDLIEKHSLYTDENATKHNQQVDLRNLKRELDIYRFKNLEDFYRLFINI